MGPKYFDELNIGDQFHTATRTITEADVVMFAGLTGDYAELHTSQTAAEKNQFGRRIAHGMLVLSYAHGLFMATGLTGAPVGIAFAGIENWTFKAPVFFGDTINVRISVAEKKASRSKPDRGLVKFFFEILNQEGKVVQEGIKMIMLKKSPEALAAQQAQT